MRSFRSTWSWKSSTQGLSITTFRYVPPGVDRHDPAVSKYLDRLNEELLNRIQAGGEAFFSNAVTGGRFALRLCIVNFRTTEEDIAALPEIVIRAGRATGAAMRAPSRT